MHRATSSKPPAGSNALRKSEVKVYRVKIMLGKATIVVTCPDLDMAKLSDLMSETQKECRKAVDTYDVGTFERMMADRAKKAA